MSAKMEQYLQRERNKLDVESPDDAAVWEGIREQLHPGKRVGMNLFSNPRLIKIRNIAAAAIILFSLGYITNDIINSRNQGNRITLSSINMELGRREKEYKTLVRFKTEEVSSFTGSGDAVLKELFEELKKLDKEYDEAMADLKELGPDEKVINTIFNTYEQKIRLLELIILETNKINRHENNEKIIL
jgi:hypothetical protein